MEKNYFIGLFATVLVFYIGYWFASFVFYVIGLILGDGKE
jgi:hypothetical protein